MTKDKLWKDITAALEEINSAADTIGGFELDEAEQAEALALITGAAQKVRSILHEYTHEESA